MIYRIAVGCLAIMGLGCTNVFYQPTRLEYFNPSESKELKPKDLTFKSLDGTELNAWYFLAKNQPAKATIIQFHGNAENMTSHFMSLVWVLNQGYNLFTFDYRGYGKSKGTAYPEGIYQDGISALQKVMEETGQKPKSIIVYGQSLGGAIALRSLQELKDRTPFRAIVIESSFLSYQSISVAKLSDIWLTWLFQWLGYLLVTDEYSPKKRMAELSPLPILVVHGTKDPVVPIGQGKQIYEKAAEPKCFWPIESDVHINLMNIDQGKYRKPMLDFFERQACPHFEKK